MKKLSMLIASLFMVTAINAQTNTSTQNTTAGTTTNTINLIDNGTYDGGRSLVDTNSTSNSTSSVTTNNVSTSTSNAISTSTVNSNSVNTNTNNNTNVNTNNKIQEISFSLSFFFLKKIPATEKH